MEVILNLGIFGSRTLKDERVKIIILEKIEELKPDKLITCQEPQGVSEVAQRVSKELGIPLQLHFLNFKYFRGAFERRSKEIVKESDFFLIIHDGESKGTANEFKLVKKSGKPFSYELLEKTPYQRSVGFNVKEEWGKEAENDLGIAFELD
jgi:hypothetical protein